MIIHYSGEKSKENYYERKLVLQAAYKQTSNGGAKCPVCGGEVVLHGAYGRSVIDGAGERHWGWVAQVRCVGCGKHHSLIPSFIMPYKQYGAEVIEAALEHEETGGMASSDCPASDTTIRRWVRQFGERGAQAAGWLLSILYGIYGQHVSAIEQQGEGQLNRLGRRARRLLPASGRGAIDRANIILTKHNHGYL
jgi:hypothetical protein